MREASQAAIHLREIRKTPRHARRSQSSNSGQPLPELLKRGRKIEAAFSDGETLVGATEAYHPQKSGFFMFLADPKSNNTRVFVVNKNLRHIKFL